MELLQAGEGLLVMLLERSKCKCPGLDSLDLTKPVATCAQWWHPAVVSQKLS